MATGIRNINPESTASVLDQIPHFTDGQDGYVTVSEAELGALKNYIQGEFDPEAAAEALETITAREDLADAATRGLDDDADIDLSELLGFRRAKGAVQRVTPVRFTTNEEGNGVLLIMGSLKVPGTQEGKTLTVGGLGCNIIEDYNLETKKTSKGEIHFHTVDLTDEESGSIYRVAMYVQQGLEPAAVKLALKAGSPLEEILSGPGSGGMGGAVNLRDVVTEEQIPWRADITEVRQYESESEFALDGKSYSAALADGLVVWMRGEAEKKLHENFEKIKADLAAGKTWTLKVTNLLRDGDRVRMRTGLESKAAGSYFQDLLAAASEEPKAELPAAKAEVKEAPAKDVKAAPAKRSNPFAKKKAAA